MKAISIRELHRRTGAWVRSARKYGSILIHDRNMPVARLVSADAAPAVNRFNRWKPREKFSGPLERPVRRRVEIAISRDRDR
jgi:antitoxin (DNA-binding transcriptional repressor) of toxin-antitoxin stability system